MKKEKKIIIYKIMRRIFTILFIGFTVLYFSQATGYYEYQLHEKVILNEEKIKQFEQDIKDGKNIDIDDYVKEDVDDYANTVSKVGLNISSKVGDAMKNGIASIFNYISKMVEE